ncbi:hypothetical protein PR048_002038 [Dryococelus australis]|uniref:Uncharacterized protein n=1 Tax=Dryococelus australis TaxID=614101 RepID=A0ABQ9ILM8_9NEOP|nr:hypothetical protein PR048_002038 [Dryococelus australis]
MDVQPVVRLCPLSRILGLDGPFQQCLSFLLKLAWSSRFRLPVLITVGFMILDIRMQLEINVDIVVRHQHLEGVIEEIDVEDNETDNEDDD